jgi:DNA-binding MarR family transcriptional regulator
VSPEPEAQVDREADGAALLRELLHRVELAGQHQRAARARQTGVHQVELAALEHLSVSGGLTPGELGHRLGLTSGGVTALAGRLIAQGHAVRADHPRDKRMRILTATPEGEAHLAEQIQPVLAPADRVLAWVGDDDAELLARFLDSLAALKEHAAESTPGPERAPTSEPYSPALLM